MNAFNDGIDMLHQAILLVTKDLQISYTFIIKETEI